MLDESLTYLRTSDDWVQTVLIGGLLSLLGVLILPAILVAGYLVRVLRGTMHGDDVPPRFDDWGPLAGDGVRAVVIAFVYGVVPGLLVAATAAAGALIAGPGPRSGLLVGGVVLVGGLFALIAGLLAAYVVPAAVANYAERGSLRAGFAVDDLRPVLSSGTYATAWLLAFALLVGAGIVAGALNAVPVLGTLVGAFLSFYAAVAAYYVVGHAWGDVRGLTLHDDEDGGVGAESTTA
ncbi:DUF4013 domain-containing protein [Haloplanus rallus]|uniref:DUF4013 domain-containing protein n=1 Tax=Haloplanus rallus TaxID=1816183 RepID=A0A6B9FGL2_9EURY|nr:MULTISPECIES: DUF4013 domain-containing protein [Haloplanus]QGX96259.1 DUF4013 domain-containing protein [Haloplanus rallus]